MLTITSRHIRGTNLAPISNSNPWSRGRESSTLTTRPSTPPRQGPVQACVCTEEAYTMKSVLRDHCRQRPLVFKDHKFLAQSSFRTGYTVNTKSAICSKQSRFISFCLQSLVGDDRGGGGPQTNQVDPALKPEDRNPEGWVPDKARAQPDPGAFISCRTFREHLCFLQC